MALLRLPNGGRARLHITAMHRRNRKGRPYGRPTDWAAEAADATALGRTQSEATARLILLLVAPLRPGNAVNFKS